MSSATHQATAAPDVLPFLHGRNWSSSAQVIRGFDETAWLCSSIDSVCREISSSPESPKIRVFVDHGNRTDLAVMLSRTPMEPSENLDDWVRRTLGVDRYCVAFNGVSAWDEKLASYLQRKLINPIIARLGAPLRGFDAYLFAGRYDLTPFGIHTDSEPSILLQLGPAPKQALVWPRELFARIAGTESNINEFDVEKWEPYATKYVLHPGDLLYLPVDEPHVMISNEYSITLGLIPNPTDTKTLFVEVARELSEDIGPFFQDISFVENSSDILPRLSDRYSELFSGAAEAIDRIRLRLESNGFLLPPPRASRASILGDDAQFRVSVDNPIRFAQVGDRVRVYVRGHVVTLPAEELLIEWLASLRQGSTTTYGAITSTLGDRFELLAIERILRTLVEFRALDEIEKEERHMTASPNMIGSFR